MSSFLFQIGHLFNEGFEHLRIIIVRSIPMAPSPVTCQKSNFKIKSDTKFTFLQCVHKIANFLSFTFKSESLFC